MIVAAHKGPVYAIATFVNGFVSGGKDGKVRHSHDYWSLLCLSLKMSESGACRGSYSSRFRVQGSGFRVDVGDWGLQRELQFGV